MFEEKHIVSDETVVIKMPAIEDWTITSLRYTCKKNKVKGYTKMTKDQLVQEVKNIIHNYHKEKEEKQENLDWI